MKTLTLNQLINTLIAYDMIIFNGKPTTKDLTLKLDKNPKKKHNDSFCESDEEEAKFTRKIKRGSGKYRGKLPFMCFNCGKVFRYVSRRPKKKKKEHDPREKF